MKYDTRFLGREMVGSEIMFFRVKKPGEFKFLAGQFCFVIVPDIGFQDERGLRRPFSIASSPLEEDLLFVMKTSDSALKRTMSGISPGTLVVVESPVGNLTLPNETNVPLVFIAGGVGIAPFRSLIRYAVDANTGHAITLFYSSQIPEETPFLGEMQHIPKKYPRVAVIVTMTRAGEAQANWSGFTSRINPEMIKDGCRSWESAIYYIVGPPPMANGMKQMLQGMNIPPARIKMELFTGY